MPVLVEAVGTPSAQDRIDLAKIYADAPAWLLAPYDTAEALIEAGLASGRLIAGRFNDRLLGAALLQPGEQAWQLSHLCVRRVTRRRGVGRRLLEEAERLTGEAGKTLRLAAPTDHLEAQALAARAHLPLQPLQP
ncbi:aspartate 1-decarboxylase autocleavage activator PanM [Stutzerimonas nosocomialis]|uniref:Aspartate 1-decarboxylase autocleavage activator PanM n=1 Tax=Stutzerimonas nosocomialis TaxID=1056496 RepID=A0A5R9QJ07_9GAMM|nr:aspartate 1-decarboxylase autocleavage activator PanM [Stutzerimonas nosocomialis]TLX58920.1 aspartate 1-decarboxylase autocleavage activator PanM [Stutzerimonas nosocomialis]TLX61066.1 aspartate 1-decarboxylase autocleavage activator PanM [Stutzerimonas nosocomialis]TLX64913.1 aspartate 1-decarboxylase autocleavage activator PanM [Stutzerimonas nosocomialis]